MRDAERRELRTLAIALLASLLVWNVPFGGIALFVGSFVIANTLSITIAQRTRELATLRSLGAMRRQVLRSVLLEALVIGTLASVVGLFCGLGLAKALNSLLNSLGIDLPAASTVFATRTVIVKVSYFPPGNEAASDETAAFLQAASHWTPR